MSDANAVKTSISLPPDLFEEAKRASDNFSQLVAEALRAYLHEGRVEAAIESFGSWEPREQSSVDLVNELRKEPRPDDESSSSN